MHLGLEVKFVFKPPIDLGSAYEMLAVLLPVGMGGKGANNPAIFSERESEREITGFHQQLPLPQVEIPLGASIDITDPRTVRDMRIFPTIQSSCC